MSLCNCIGQSEVKLDHLKFIYESCIKATNKLKSYSFTVIVSGRAGGFLIGGAEMVRVGRRGGGQEGGGWMLLQYLRVKEREKDFSRDRVLYFEVWW